MFLFFMVAFFARPNMTTGQLATLHYLSSIAAGLVGFFISGTAVVEFTDEMSKGKKLFVRCTSGFALFLLCFFASPFTQDLPPWQFGEGFAIGYKDGTTFKAALNVVGGRQQKPIELQGFTPEEQNQLITKTYVAGRSFDELMQQLRPSLEKFPEYEVVHANDKIVIRARRTEGNAK